jgi:hypothetical protein
MKWRDKEYDDQDEDVDEALSDREMPDESDMDADDDPEEVACPYCGEMICELAQWCPRCENYLSAEDRPLRRRTARPRWVVWTALATLAALLAGGAYCIRWW